MKAVYNIFGSVLLCFIFTISVYAFHWNDSIPIVLVESYNQPKDGPDRSQSEPTDPTQIYAYIEGRMMTLMTPNDFSYRAVIIYEEVDSIVIDQRFTGSFAHVLPAYGKYSLYVYYEEGSLGGSFYSLLTQAEAAELVLQQFSEDSVDIYLSDVLLGVQDTVKMGIDEIFDPISPTDDYQWFAYVDMKPNANLSHDFTVIFIDARTGEMVQRYLPFAFLPSNGFYHKYKGYYPHTLIDRLNAVHIPSFIYPNPIGDIMSIELATGESVEEVFIYNTAGELVLKSQNRAIEQRSTIDTSTLLNGIYFVVVHSQKKIYNAKVIKQ